MNRRDIITRITKNMGMSEELLLNVNKQKEYTDTRYVIIKYLYECCDCNFAEIGRLLNINRSSVLRNYNSRRVDSLTYKDVLLRSCITIC